MHCLSQAGVVCKQSILKRGRVGGLEGEGGGVPRKATYSKLIFPQPTVWHAGVRDAEGQQRNLGAQGQLSHSHPLNILFPSGLGPDLFIRRGAVLALRPTPKK